LQVTTAWYFVSSPPMISFGEKELWFKVQFFLVSIAVFESEAPLWSSLWSWKIFCRGKRGLDIYILLMLELHDLKKKVK